MDEYLPRWSRMRKPGRPASARRPIRLEADQLRLHPDKAVSLGVSSTNSSAMPANMPTPRASGEVRVRFGNDGDGHFHLVVEDDGVGLTEGAAPRGSGLGSRLVLAMAKSLASELDYDPAHRGVRASLRAAI